MSTPDDQLTDQQLHALDRLWHARREGVGESEARAVEQLIRAGRMWHAGRLLAESKRTAEPGPPDDATFTPPPATPDAGSAPVRPR